MRRHASELPSCCPRATLPREASYSGRIAEDCTFIIVLSYCWASPKHPDPENKLLANVCEFFGVSGRFAALWKGRQLVPELDPC